MTIPTLVKNYQNATYVTALQKMTSTLNNGLKQIMANTGCSDIVCTGIIDSNQDTTIDNIGNSNVFSVAKKCYKNQTGCNDKLTYTLVNNIPWLYIKDYYSVLELKDGSIFGVYVPSPNCNNVSGVNQYASTCWQQGLIDVNGVKAPNVLGRDIFKFFLSKNGIILPAGTTDDTFIRHWTTYINSNCSDACFGRIVENSWQMDY